MGGAGAWHIGAHYAERFAAVHAGAGFVDVARYQRLSPADYPPAYEQRLWGLYDVPDYVRNLFNLPVVAYSGEVDKQKDAADFMAEAFRQEGLELTHLIGPGMAHKYDPAVLAEVMRRMHEAAQKGRNTQADSVSLQTRTLALQPPALGRSAGARPALARQPHRCPVRKRRPPGREH